MELLPALRSLRVAAPDGPGMVTMATTADHFAVDSSGNALLEHSVPMSGTTSLYAASLAKLVTALCVHRLAIDGRLHLDEPVSRWFPSLAAGDRITVRQLLLHRSGLPEYHALRLLAGHSVEDRLDQSDVARLVDGMTTWFDPGTKVSYNNTNFAMLAMVVGWVTDQSFAEAALQLVFEPAGMHTAVVRQHPDSLIPGAAGGYVPNGDGFRRAVIGAASVGDGGMWWSGNDLVGLGRWLLGDHEEVAAMRQRVPMPDGSLPTLATGCTIAADGSWFGGAAEFTGFSAELRVYPEAGIAIGAMSNRQDARPARHLDTLRAALDLPRVPPPEPRPLRAGHAPTGTMLGVGGAVWNFDADESANQSNGVVRVGVGALSFRLLPTAQGWHVEGMASHVAGWDGDEFVLRDGAVERARLIKVGGERVTAEALTALAGWWWCPSAAAVMQTIAEDGKLSVRRGQCPPEPLAPVGDRSGRWVVAAPWGLLEFDRDGRKAWASLGRAEGVPLQRLAIAQPV